MQETQQDAEFWKDEEFMLYSFKVTPCKKGYRHNWRRCPFAHEDETARRRDPKVYSYTAIICPHAKKKERCPRGNECPWAHNIFEYWLLPSRFKTQLCNHGSKESCKRHFCFFAHNEDELRHVPEDEALPNVSQDPIEPTDMVEANAQHPQDEGELWPMTDLFKAMDLGHCNSGLEAIPYAAHPHTDSILAIAEAKSTQASCHSDIGYIDDRQNMRGPLGLMHQESQRNYCIDTHEENGLFSTQSASFLPIADSLGTLNDFHHKRSFINDTEIVGFGSLNTDNCSKDDSDECELPSNQILRTLKICKSGK